MGKKKSQSPADPQTVAFRRRLALRGIALLLALGLATAGWIQLRKHVERSLSFPERAPAIVLKDQPVWMSPDLAYRIADAASPRQRVSSFDTSILSEVYHRLMNNPDVAPYIAELRQVRRVYGQGPGDTIEIDATYRAPVALVRAPGAVERYWLVDSQGVVLPDSFSADEIETAERERNTQAAMRIIQGVAQRPPAAGTVWSGEDLAAGLDLVKVIHDKPFAADIERVDVANYGGRLQPGEAQLKLLTRWNTEIRWGRPVNPKDFFIEVSTARKLERLTEIYARYRRADAHFPWIDIRFDVVTHPAGDTLAPEARQASAGE